MATIATATASAAARNLPSSSSSGWLRRRRVVVTGVGAVTPLGLTFLDSWRALCRGDSGLTTLDEALREQQQSQQQQQQLELAARLSCQVAAPVRGFSPTTTTTTSSRTTTTRAVQMALVAAAEAVAQAGLVIHDNDSDDNDNEASSFRRGVSIGTGMSGVCEIVQAVMMQQQQQEQQEQQSSSSAYRFLSPHFVPQILPNAAASRMALAYRCRGPGMSASTACAASAHAIGDAARWIMSGHADVMLAGGAEASMDPLSLAGFQKLRALSTRYNDTPALASRPFDAHRDGFVMGEGACVLVLEELEHARQRLQALGKYYHGSEHDHHYCVELVGYGATSDAHHITSPDPCGQGAVRAMQMALRDAQDAAASLQQPHQYQPHPWIPTYVNAHATSTPKGDDIEARAIHQALFSSSLSSSSLPDEEHNVWVSSTKGQTGHLLGAAGALEAAFTVQSLLDQRLPATANLLQPPDQLQPGGLLRHVLPDDRGRAMAHDYNQDPSFFDGNDDYNLAMSNSFGFGGTNASLLFRRIKLEL